MQKLPSSVFRQGIGVFYVEKLKFSYAFFIHIMKICSSLLKKDYLMIIKLLRPLKYLFLEKPGYFVFLGVFFLPTLSLIDSTGWTYRLRIVSYFDIT